MRIFSLILLAVIIIGVAMLSTGSKQRIRIVGSSTVYPYVTIVAEQFGIGTEHPTPIVESTGTGGGFKLFCSGIGERFPDINNASRAIKDSEVELCAGNGITDIIELPIGYDGIVLANNIEGESFFLSKEDIFDSL